MKIYHHNDLDGRCAGALVSYYTDNRDPMNFIEVNYVKVPDASYVRNGEDVFIVDYCFTKETIYQLKAFLDRGCHVVWIDHHKSSADLLLTADKSDTGELDFLKNDRLRVVVDTKLCGAALTYLYFSYDFGSIMPKFLRYVDDWDRWTKKYTESYKFKLGMDLRDHSPTSKIWRSLMFDPDVTEKILQEGDIIEQYVKSYYHEYSGQFAFKCVFHDLKCYALNLRSNSKAFGDLFNQCDAVITFVFNGESYQYSIYSAKPNVDCAKIAEMYGGGGHKDAAGFEADALILKRSDWK